MVTATLIALRRSAILPCFQQSRTESSRSRWFPVAATVCVLVLAPTLDREKLAWAGLAFVGLVGTYGSLIRTFDMNNEHMNGVLRLDMLSAMRAITGRAMGVLYIVIGVLMLLASSQISSGSRAKSLAVGAMKAVHWMSMFSLVSNLLFTPYQCLH